ncbi:MAG: argininosuccinate lyase [Actinomycetota bacterium]
MKMWGGRFEKETAKSVEEFTSSISFDKRLYAEDIKVSMAHASMLGHTGIITEDEGSEIKAGLSQILEEIESGEFEFQETDEDIHTAIERRLIELIGPVGGKLRTARSRNDQVVTDLRLFLKGEIAEVAKLAIELQETLINRAEQDGEVVMPGYTHLQRAQPVLLAHHLLAYFFMLERDMRRLKGSYDRTNILPLGAGALAGTTFPIDRHFLAKELSFAKVSENSMDAVSDRDFVIEFLAAASMIMLHLSRLAEEIVLWASAEFDFVEIDEAYATGSSIMPQKKNPDGAELVRGKAGRVFGHLQAMLSTLKGLPLSYNRDMQEDKEGLFDTTEVLKTSLKVFNGMVSTMKFKPERMLKAAEGNFGTATDAADYLATKGMPFPEAHQVVGNLVKHCQEKGLTFSDLDLETFKDFSPLFERDIVDIVRVKRAVERRGSYGGTAPERVKEQLQMAKKFLTGEREWLKRL